MVCLDSSGRGALYRVIEGAERHGQSDDDDDATEGEEHGRGSGAAHSVIAFVTEVWVLWTVV